MPKSKNHNLQVLKRRELVAKSYLDGNNVRRIAEELQISVGTVSNDLKSVQSEWLGQAVENVSRHKALLLAKINHLEALAWEAWERSVGEIVVTTNRGTKRSPSKSSACGTVILTQEVRRKSLGDPRFLQIVAGCIDQRATILGLKSSCANSANDHLSVVGFEIVAPDGTVIDEMNEMNE